MCSFMELEREIPASTVYTGFELTQLCRIGSFYAFILNRAPTVRLTLVARSNYEAVKANVSLFFPQPKACSRDNHRASH
jgi:hypothetical protein